MTQSDPTQPPLEVTPHPGSYCDQQSRLFIAGGRLLRGLNGLGAKIYRDLEERGVLKQLLDEGLLVETWVCDQPLPDWELVIEHRRVPFVVAPSEWSAEMFYAAGKMILRMQSILAKHGYAIYDPHPWNVLFDGPRPVYIDFGSICASDPNDFHWMYYATFEKAFVHSLRVLKAGHGRTFRAMYRDYNLTPSQWEIDVLAGPPSLQRRVRDVARRVQRRLDYRRRKLQARRVLKAGGTLEPSKPDLPTAASLAKTPKRCRFMRRLSMEFKRRKPTAHPYKPKSGDLVQPIDAPESWTGWQPLVAEWIDRLKPETLVDIGEGGGWYARYAASKGVPALFLEPNENHADAQYRHARDAGATALPIVANPRYPTPGYGVQNTEVPAAISRLRGDMVITMGMTTDYREWNYPPWMAAQIVTAFTIRWSLFEVLAMTDDMRESWGKQQWGEYSAQTYIKAFEDFGCKAQIVGEQADGSMLLLIDHEHSKPEHS